MLWIPCWHSTAGRIAMVEELPVSDESSTWFPSRPVVLPDELLGALLLPSDPGSSQGSGSASSPNRSKASHEDVLSGSILSASGSAERGRRQRPSSVTFSSDGGSPMVGLGGARLCQELGSSSVSHSSKSKDWSLSDPDVRELLKEEELIDESVSGSQVDVTSPGDGPAATPTQDRSIEMPKVGLALPSLEANLSSSSRASSRSGKEAGGDGSSSMEDSLALESVTSVSAMISD